MSTYYHLCPDCGCTLDPGEVCECQKEKEAHMIICEKSARAESYSWLKQLCQENGYTIIEVSRETQERFEREHGHPVAFDILHKGDIRTLFIHETATNASIISCIEHCFGVRQWCVKRLAN